MDGVGRDCSQDDSKTIPKRGKGDIVKRYDPEWLRGNGHRCVAILALVVAALVMLSGQESFAALGFGPSSTLNTNADSDWGEDDESWWGHDYASQVTTDGLGNWVAVWPSTVNLGDTAGTDDDIFVSRSTDNGATWSAPATLNNNADTDLGYDWFPQLTTDSSGNWVAVWWSEENLGGSVETDADIFVSITNDFDFPAVLVVACLWGREVHVTFSERMGAGVLDPANYTISGAGMGTVSVHPDSVSLVSGNIYRLWWNTGSINVGGDITITVTGVEDATGTSIGLKNFGTTAAIPVNLSNFKIE